MRRIVLCLVLLCGLVLTSAPAFAYVPKEGGTFNVPPPWGDTEQTYRIIRHVEEAIRQVRPTADDPTPIILISAYLMDRKPSSDALIGACRRGVSVRVILDSGIGTKSAQNLIEVLNGDNPRDTDGDGVLEPPRRGPCNTPLPPPVEEPPPASPRLMPDRVETDALGRELESSTGDWSQKRIVNSLAIPTDSQATWGSDGSYVTQCVGSCRGNANGAGNMHSKFYAMSNSGDARWVSMISSSNLNLGGGEYGWNDLYTTSNRQKTFEGYRQIHREMTEDKPGGGELREVVDGPFTTRFFPMAKATMANDPVLDDLNKIRCRGSSLGRTQVHVSMFGWRGTRGTYLADKVFSLKGQGCAVSVIFGAPSKQMAIYLRQKARATGVPLYNSRWDLTGDDRKELRAHTKYVLVKGAYGDNNTAYEVMTGSANWVDGGLDKGDENTLNISLRSAWTEYKRNWEQIRKHSVRVAGGR
ncbi:hypothetical protein G7072_03060 [Nocardioides sp. HDW12B]|uniref:phospholipase D-like domain-containing protein n=1 Tax=Nocardioides sp. HDW12B TaxID=2714939 RepID=UPI00140E58D8|nr:phospholipase D-like domain-containing protein [Nocardioides sp. HDW12B]QIK65455.1 hypothetical protein G7072_03060 [Nocardioides sp. HDW12B]